MPCDISDEEFEDNLEKVYEAWESRIGDTVDITRLCGISEAKVDWILSCYMEGMFDQMEDARMALKGYRSFDPVAIVADAIGAKEMA